MKFLEKSFNIHDTTLSSILDWRGPANDTLREQKFAECQALYEDLRLVLMNSGWKVQMDPNALKHYRCIAKYRHVGQRGDLRFASSVTGRCIEIIFHESVIRDNPNGARYGFNKMEKMPYLLRLRTKLEMRRVSEFLMERGYVDRSKLRPELGLDAIMQHRTELEDFQGNDFYQRERQRYNCTDADGVEMYDGDRRYLWTWNGRLSRGVVYRHINNMWWVHTGPYSYSNQGNFQLFVWTPQMGRKRRVSPGKVAARLQDELDKAVTAQNFERAIVLRNLLRSMKPSEAAA